MQGENVVITAASMAVSHMCFNNTKTKELHMFRTKLEKSKKHEDKSQIHYTAGHIHNTENNASLKHAVTLNQRQQIKICMTAAKDCVQNSPHIHTPNDCIILSVFNILTTDHPFTHMCISRYS